MFEAVAHENKRQAPPQKNSKPKIENTAVISKAVPTNENPLNKHTKAITKHATDASQWSSGSMSEPGFAHTRLIHFIVILLTF